MNLTLEQLRERDRAADQELREIACAGRLYPGALLAAVNHPNNFITETVFERIVNALVWLEERGAS